MCSICLNAQEFPLLFILWNPVILLDIMHQSFQVHDMSFQNVVFMYMKVFMSYSS